MGLIALGASVSSFPGTKPFSSGCQTKELTAQQKALELILFDLGSCAQDDRAQELVVPR